MTGRSKGFLLSTGMALAIGISTAGVASAGAASAAQVPGRAAVSQHAAAKSKTVTVKTHGPKLNVRTSARTTARSVRKLRNGQKVVITCHVYGEAVSGTFGRSRLWDRVKGGGYVSDTFLYTGSDGPVVPRCKGSKPPPPPPAKAKLAYEGNKYVGGYARKACHKAGLYNSHYQCKYFVSCLSKLVYGRRISGSNPYYTAYLKSGYRQVSRGKARPGDIIQLSKGTRSGYYSGMHTAVMASAFSKGGTATVIDSNFGGDSRGWERVRKHRWNPYDRARKRGLTVRVWRYAGR